MGDRPRRAALLLVDVQEEYRKQMMPRGVLDRLMRLVKAARAAGVPIIWSRWRRSGPSDGHYGALDEFFGPWGVASHDNSLYLASAGGAEVLHEIAPTTAAERARVIDSRTFDCFAAPALDSTGAAAPLSHSSSRLRGMLDAHGVDTLLVAGCWTESCILATAVRAVAEDFNVSVAQDACFTCAEAGEAALTVLRLYALVVPTDEVVAWLQEASTGAPGVRAAPLPIALARSP